MDRYRVLETLRARRGEWFPAAELAARLNANVRDVKRAIRELGGLGYLIETDAERGLRYAGSEDRLLGYEIVRDLDVRLIGRDVVCLESATSTNDVAWERVDQGAAEGLTIFAEAQRRGRGRQGRRWLSPRRTGLLMSIILRPGLPREHTSALTAIAAVAVVEALQELLHVPALIRWPNDIVLRGRKLGGILVEARETGAEAAFVLGIGLNVNLEEARMPASVRDLATSLSIHLGRKVDRVALARRVLEELDRWYAELRAGRYSAINSHWRRYSATLGGRITIIENGRRYVGRVLDLALEEGLMLRLDGGGTRVFDGAQVSVVNGAGG